MKIIMMVCSLTLVSNVLVKAMEERVVEERQIATPGEGRQILTPLHQAVSINDAPGVARILLGHEQDINAKDQFGNTPLHLAVASSRYEIIALLVLAGADVNVENNQGWRPIHDAAAREVSIVELLMKKGVDFNISDKNGITPLHEAAAKGTIDVAQIYLKQTSKASLKFRSGNTPLHRAIENKTPEVLKLFLENYEGLDVSSYNSKTLLKKAILLLNIKAIKLFLEAGVSACAQDESLNTPLHYAVKIDDTASLAIRPKPGEEESAKRLAIIELLLAYGADVNAVNFNGSRPSHSAQRNNLSEIADYLKDKEMHNVSGQHGSILASSYIL